MVALFIVAALLGVVAALALSPIPWGGGPRGWIHTGEHTEYAGNGRVWFVSFLGGAGYCWYITRGRGWDGKPREAPGFRPTIAIRGFTFYVRTAASTTSPYRTHGTPVRRFRIATNPNQPIC